MYESFISEAKGYNRSWNYISNSHKDLAKRLTKETDWEMLTFEGGWQPTNYDFRLRGVNVYRLKKNFTLEPKIEIAVKINGKEARLSDISEETMKKLREI